VKLKDQVHAINTGANSIDAILLEPFKPQIVTADTSGKIRVFDYIQSKKINEFHSGRSGLPRAPTTSLYRLNTLYNELLLTCAANGHVSAWRYYSKTGCSSPVTSWQSVLSSVSSFEYSAYELIRLQSSVFSVFREFLSNLRYSLFLEHTLEELYSQPAQLGARSQSSTSGTFIVNYASHN